MISICCPSRGRPEYAKRLYDSILDTAEAEIEFLLYLNDDDPELDKYFEEFKDTEVDPIVGKDQSTCYSWNQLAFKAKYDVCFLMGDDVQFTTNSWDKEILKIFDQYADKIVMVSPLDNRKSQARRNERIIKNMKEPYYIKNFPTHIGTPHFCLHKNWINAVGYFAPPQFWHWYVDTWTKKIAIKLGRCVILPYAQYKSKKFTTDNTARRIRGIKNINERDNWVWEKTQSRWLTAEIDLLKKFIEDYEKPVSKN